MPKRKRIQREHTEDWQTIQQYQQQAISHLKHMYESRQELKGVLH